MDKLSAHPQNRSHRSSAMPADKQELRKLNMGFTPLNEDSSPQTSLFHRREHHPMPPTNNDVATIWSHDSQRWTPRETSRTASATNGISTGLSRMNFWFLFVLLFEVHFFSPANTFINFFCFLFCFCFFYLFSVPSDSTQVIIEPSSKALASKVSLDIGYVCLLTGLI